MSNIQKRDNGKWRARYRDESGKEHARHFARKVDAQRWLDEVTASVMTGNYVDPRAGKVTFGEYAAAWQSSHIHRPNTAAAVDTALRVHALPAFGSRQISSIRPSEIQAFVQGLTSTLAPATVRVTYQHLRAVFKAAEADRIIARTPCQRITLPAVERVAVQPLATEVVLGLERAMPSRWRALIP
ncbi:MAG: traSA:integrase fusion protein, partial [Marmoricola sp.]|nr:traSA:integrase fusion protein [Marmoricola sp.]